MGKWARMRSALCSALLRAKPDMVLWSLIILAAFLTISAQLLEVVLRIAVTQCEARGVLGEGKWMKEHAASRIKMCMQGRN